MAKEKTINLDLSQGGAFQMRSPYSDNKREYWVALLSFSEVSKLERGNANVRPPAETRATLGMFDTVLHTPQTFLEKNRGIIYICDEVKEKRGQLVVTAGGGGMYGIADGGHTFEVVCQSVERAKENIEIAKGWVEPYVWVKFYPMPGATREDIAPIVEAVNTSIQVQASTMYDYQGKFEELKRALREGGFDPKHVAWRENVKNAWRQRDVIQRMACFLQRWNKRGAGTPKSMYSSKNRAVEYYVDEETRGEFRELYDVIVDVVTLPERLQHKISSEPKYAGKLKQLEIVRELKRQYFKPGAEKYPTKHKIDMAGLLPMASAFRVILKQGKDGRLAWSMKLDNVIENCIDDLFAVLFAFSKKAPYPSQIAFDDAYWEACENVLLKATR
jgi:hypothetical protein